jgi:hypothetical protein
MVVRVVQQRDNNDGKGDFRLDRASFDVSTRVQALPKERDIETPAIAGLSNRNGRHRHGTTLEALLSKSTKGPFHIHQVNARGSQSTRCVEAPQRRCHHPNLGGFVIVRIWDANRDLVRSIAAHGQQFNEQAVPRGDLCGYARTVYTTTIFRVPWWTVWRILP